MAFCALLSLFYMMNMLTIVRVHYTIDIAGGLIFSIFWSRNVNPFIYYCDWIISLPYVAGKKLVEKWKDSNMLYLVPNGNNESPLSIESLYSFV